MELGEFHLVITPVLSSPSLDILSQAGETSMDVAETGRVRRSPEPSPQSGEPHTSWPGVPVEGLRIAAQASMVGAFLLMIGALLYVAESLIAPVVAAAVVSTLFRTLYARLSRFKIPVALYALVCVVLFAAAVNIILVLLAGTISDWTSRGPEVVEALKAKAAILERPLSILREIHQGLNSLLGGSLGDMKVELPTAALVTPVLGFLTPALGELIIFFGSLFFFIYERDRQRHLLVLMFQGQEARLRTLKLLNDVERSLTRYIGMVSVINIAMGAVTAVIAYACGLPNAFFLGVLAFLLNYIPYVGAAGITVVLFLFGVTSTPTLASALVAPALFVAVATIEGHFITPNVVTRNLTVGALTTFLCLAFWTWLWGPIGAFLATPILIVAVLIREHARDDEVVRLPGDEPPAEKHFATSRV
jgi:predicted PurR-regulated permease PerM